MFVDIEFAILIGVALSVLWYVPRAARLKATELVVSAERVVRERLPTDSPAREVLIVDLEGELFFGAAPDLERHLHEAATRAKTQGIAQLVLRVKRVRNPDVVALEELDKFLRAAPGRGLTVLLAGVRPDLLQALQRIGITAYLSADLVSPKRRTTSPPR